MRRTVRPWSQQLMTVAARPSQPGTVRIAPRAPRFTTQTTPQERLGRAVATLPTAARAALRTVADRDDLPLVAGTWQEGDGGCLVANVLAAHASESPSDADGETLDVRVLRLFPELSSRDLNRLIVAWDEAADACGASQSNLRDLLHGALAGAGGRAVGAATAGASAPSRA